MKQDKFARLNPKNWSVAVWRTLAALTILVNLALGVTVVMLLSILGPEGVGVFGVYRSILKVLALFTLLWNFLFIWLVISVEQGYRKGFLMALGVMVCILLLFDIWEHVIGQMLNWW